MAQTINGNNCFDAWQSAAQLIANHGAQNNLILTIQQPGDFVNLQNWLSDRNPKSIIRGADNLLSVIRTIFPYTLANYFPNRNDLYNKYRTIYQRGLNRSWGTYFQRLISFDNHFQNNGINQLEGAINALNGGSPQRAYIVFHLSARNLESNTRPMGAPCWHFGQITINDDRSLNLIAVYRLHDYFNKGLGNFIGLAKLLEFICRETNRPMGELVIHSIQAYSATSPKNLRSLAQ
ncbi:MAG TPA: hypothetical protein VGD89_07510 [Flavipsychrobacter sp.]